MPQYPTRGGIESMPEYLEARSDKSILSNSICDVANIILKNNYFEKTYVKDHQKKGFAIRSSFAPPYSNLFITGLEKIIFLQQLV